MKTTRLIFASVVFGVVIAGSVAAQTRPQTVPSRPTPTPTPRPTATPLPRPGATPLPRPAATPMPTSALNVAVPESRIALVNTEMFGDEKNGIYRYIDAARIVQTEFQPRTSELQNLQNRLNTLASEIQTLMKASVVDQKTIQAKQSEGERLEQDFAAKKERLDQDVTRRYQQVVSPVSKQIGVALDQFARQRGVTMTLDISKLLPAILTVLPGVDMTAAFIADFNSKNPRTGPPPRQ
ncbi:MAG: OmpH family outer membrane protein [Acidobacteriota bacterium]